MQVGRLEVGTETLLDKAKSLKTLLMSLFRESGNYDVEGITSINACYGSTNALFNTLNWIDSSSWDGRYGIVVSSDVAVYPKGPARPTGGVGAIVMVIGPNAPIVIDPVRASFIDNAYDFYKPDPRSEYPIVDGHLSMGVYINAMRQCYETLKKKFAARNKAPFNYHSFQYFAFHTPFSKMVQKSFLALLLHDIEISHKNKLGLFNSQDEAQLASLGFKNDTKSTQFLLK